MAVKLSPEIEEQIETLVGTEGFDSADDVVSAALLALEEKNAKFWERIERLDAGADDDVNMAAISR